MQSKIYTCPIETFTTDPSEFGTTILNEATAGTNVEAHTASQSTHALPRGEAAYIRSFFTSFSLSYSDYTF